MPYIRFSQFQHNLHVNLWIFIKARKVKKFSRGLHTQTHFMRDTFAPNSHGFVEKETESMRRNSSYFYNS